ncbi:HAD family hydrolase [Vibrio campbellii]|uniref:HAD family hydrolase n=1 Tax=Vibrio campbellii (strain ATCC BAA-1116) TaxID=2902295 RepID=A7N6U8_VIBC1|nr:HAD family hydrolase [Vibrio campbellii]ABU73943.1 hypothetical protein VIBHAR_06050 [Vibrio campbellii ATCC BAA-1116]AGU98481.1 hypothetical protein M892_21640 [Vibrio campbellii ATCC BAA-1116]MBT0124630.1 HAD family hydrolase [Vibrio campbellii]MBT0139558.1 HAD family hydrolase [Vibrio campbellii]MBT0144235.1 HAD family hydrolase [Vibrio campbellii]
MYNTIVFDMDMTLCYPTKCFDEVFFEVFKAPIDSCQPEWFEKITINGVCTGKEAVDHCFPAYSAAEKDRLFQELSHQWASHQCLYEGVLSLPKKLKDKYGCRVGIMTNGPSAFQHAILEHLMLKDVFDFCYASGDIGVGIRKPSESLISLLQEKEGIIPDKALFVGDSFNKDIKPAIKCGWSGLLVSPTNSSVQRFTFADVQEAIQSGSCLEINWMELNN